MNPPWPFVLKALAEMVELVDTQASGVCGGNPVEVRVLFSAPLLLIQYPSLALYGIDYRLASDDIQQYDTGHHADKAQ